MGPGGKARELPLLSRGLTQLLQEQPSASPCAAGWSLGPLAGQGPSLGPLLHLALLKAGWAYTALLGPCSLCSKAVVSALAHGPDQDTPVPETAPCPLLPALRQKAGLTCYAHPCSLGGPWGTHFISWRAWRLSSVCCCVWGGSDGPNVGPQPPPPPGPPDSALPPSAQSLPSCKRSRRPRMAPGLQGRPQQKSCKAHPLAPPPVPPNHRQSLPRTPHPSSPPPTPAESWL